MNKLLVILLVLVPVLGFAQTWEWQNPLPQGNVLQSVAFVDANHGWAVGWYGTILNTTNGGNSWVAQSSGTSWDLYGVAFADGSHSWAVGNGGTILYTTNGGSSWVSQSSGTTNTLYAVACADGSNGWAVGSHGTIVHTTNGGSSWVTQSSGTTYPLWGVTFVDGSNGWAVGSYGTIVHTTNGGSSWVTQPSGTTYELDAVAFVGGSNGWAVGYNGTIVHTTNGGSSWVSQSSGTTNWFSGVAFADGSNGWAVGTSGTIVRTMNGGSSWVAQSSGTTNRLYSVAFADGSNGWAVGYYGTIVRTANGGSSWVPQTSGTTALLEDVFLVNSGTGWAVGYNGTIRHTTDGGSTWTGQTSGTSYHLNGATSVDESNGWAVGNSGTILHTTNGGSNWTTQTSPSAITLYEVDFVDANNGWAVGQYGYVFHTTNGGAVWTSQSSGSSVRLPGVEFVDVNNGWVVGDNGTIRHTTNGGTSWTAQPSGTTANLYEVTFVDANNGWVVGTSGTIRHTTNGGNTWVEQTSEVTTDLNEVAFPDVNHGWAVGYNGVIVQTTNGGSTWTLQSSGTANGLYGVSFPDINHGWTAGANGTILHYPDIGAPTVVITAPSEGRKVGGVFEICVHASDPNGWVDHVEVQIDDGPWANALPFPPLYWKYPWNTIPVENGWHTIRARCLDNEGNWSAVAEVQAVVLNYYFIQITDLHIEPVIPFQPTGGLESFKAVLVTLRTDFNNPKPAFVLISGDLADNGNFYTGEAYDSLKAQLFGTSSQLYLDQEMEAPVYICPGNHDYYFWPNDLGHYHQAFDYPEGEDDNYVKYYPQDLSFPGAQILSFNSRGDLPWPQDWLCDAIPPESNALEDMQPDWLQTNLGTQPDFQKFVFLHFPIFFYNTNSHCWFDGCIRTPLYFNNICQTYNVDVVLNGHINTTDNNIYTGSCYTDSVPRDTDGLEDDEGSGSDNGPWGLWQTAHYWDNADYPETIYLITSHCRDYRSYRVIAVTGETIKVYDTFVAGQRVVGSQQNSGGSSRSDQKLARLHVYDSQGNHAGEDSLGGFQNEIAGATFGFDYFDDATGDPDTLGSRASVSYGTDTYIFEIEGVGNGLIDFDIAFSSNEGRQSLHFSQVAVTDSSRGSVYISTDAIDHTLYVDENGDGVIDQEIEPDASTNQDIPYPPSTPSGPATGCTGAPLFYSSSATDPEGDQIFYLFDWGDQTNSGWLGPFNSGESCVASHAWTAPGTYEVKARAKDVSDHIGDWSHSVSVAIIGVELVREDYPAHQLGMISLPLQPMDPYVSAVFEDDLGPWEPGGDWTLMYWNGRSYDVYGEPGSDFPEPLVPGQAYWLQTSDTVDIDVTGVLVDTTQDYLIPLQPGFRCIGNPFNFPVEWDSFRVRKDGVTLPITSPHARRWIVNHFWLWDGHDWNVRQNGSFVPWEGYRVRALQDCELLVPPIPSAPGERIASTTPSVAAIPTEFALHAPYPNPFNPVTTIRYDVKETGLVSLKVFDLLGREVTTLVHETIPAGSHSIDWNAGDLPSGVYLCRMETQGFEQTRKLVLLK